MLFNSLAFVAFFVLVRLIYGRLTRRGQNTLLLAASYGFYAAWDYRFLILILLSTAIDYVCGRRLAAEPGRKLWIGVSIATNLSILGFFKYCEFFAREFAVLMSSLGWEVGPFDLEIVLPVGISFYTFQSLSYTIDVYRGKQPACHHFLDFCLYVAFFPQLVAGPIERSRHLLPQILTSRPSADWRLAIWFLLLGYFQKVVVADNLAPFIARLSQEPGSMSGGDLVLCFYAMVIFIYADFSGYSNIARGLAGTFGINLVQNFRMPLVARNPADFWQRWHISLTNWFRDYVFFPLVRFFGRRLSSTKAMGIAVLTTFLLIGLWHGAAWNFLAFGVFHGALYLLYAAWRRYRRHRMRLLWPALIKRPLDHLLAFHMISFGTIFFVIPTAQGWWQYLGGVWTKGWGLYDPTLLWTLILFAGPMLLLDVYQEYKGDIMAVTKSSVAVRGLVMVALWLFILLGGVTESREFVYFQF